MNCYSPTLNVHPIKEQSVRLTLLGHFFMIFSAV